jgi:hypothetical protein
MIFMLGQASFHSVWDFANVSVCGADALPRRFDEADNARNLHDLENHRGASASATHKVSTTLLLCTMLSCLSKIAKNVLMATSFFFVCRSSSVFCSSRLFRALLFSTT